MGSKREQGRGGHGEHGGAERVRQGGIQQGWARQERKGRGRLSFREERRKHRQLCALPRGQNPTACSPAGPRARSAMHGLQRAVCNVQFAMHHLQCSL